MQTRICKLFVYEGWGGYYIGCPITRRKNKVLFCAIIGNPLMQALACYLLNHEHRNIHNWFPPAKLVRQSTLANKCICIYRKNTSQQITAICLCLRLHFVLATSFKYLLWPARRKAEKRRSLFMEPRDGTL